MRDAPASEDLVMDTSPLTIVRPFAASVVTTLRLLAGGRLRSPRTYVGRRVGFADGSSFRVFRETILVAPCRERSVLVVRFRLRWLGRSRLGHAAFRVESLANTLLFAGFAGFRTKLWMFDEHTGEYRGLYDWDDPVQAERYATTLTVLLRLVSVPGSVAFHVDPSAARDRYLPVPHEVPDRQLAGDPDAWWQPAPVQAAR